MKSRQSVERTSLAVLGILSIGLLACSQSNGGGGGAGTGGGTSFSGSSGGVASSGGGRGGSAGAASAGGSSALGGTVGAGGTAASAGTKGSGGVQEAGGTTLVGTGGSNSGGSKAAGGTSAGGTAGTGGGSENGGSTGGGGTTRTDGGRTDGGSGDSAAGGSGTGGNGSGGSETGGAAAGGSKTGGATGNGGRGGSSGSNGSGGTVTCPSSLLKAGDTNRAVQVGSDSRSYILHAPSGYDGSKPVPLVVDFHGLSGSGSQEEGTTLYKSLTDAEGVVSAYPNGMSGPMGAGWNVGPCCVANVDDVAFAKALVADAEKVACIDPKRVYAVGFSMGGGITHYLGCHAADVFAAVAPAAFDLLKENVDGCKPSRPITVIAFRSHGDTFVNYDGGYSTYVSSMPITFLGAQTTFAKWAQIDQCTDSPSAEDSNGCSTYSSCGGGVQVTLCSKQGGTHEQGTASIGWPLLKKYTMP